MRNLLCLIFGHKWEQQKIHYEWNNNHFIIPTRMVWVCKRCDIAPEAVDDLDDRLWGEEKKDDKQE